MTQYEGRGQNQRRCLVAALLLWLTAWPVSKPQAQTMFRCGNEFSQTPCAKDATATAMRSSSASDRPQSSVMTGDALCLTRAPEAFYLTNPEALQFVRISKMPAEVIQYAGTPIAAKHLPHGFVRPHRSVPPQRRRNPRSQSGPGTGACTHALNRSAL